MIFSGFFRSILAGEGDMKFPMMVAGFGTILNIILDPILIIWLDWGLAGAAWATTISYYMSALFAVWFFVSGRSDLKIKALIKEQGVIKL